MGRAVDGPEHTALAAPAPGAQRAQGDPPKMADLLDGSAASSGRPWASPHPPELSSLLSRDGEWSWGPPTPKMPWRPSCLWSRRSRRQGSRFRGVGRGHGLPAHPCVLATSEGAGEEPRRGRGVCPWLSARLHSPEGQCSVAATALPFRSCSEGAVCLLGMGLLPLPDSAAVGRSQGALEAPQLSRGPPRRGARRQGCLPRGPCPGAGGQVSQVGSLRAKVTLRALPPILWHKVSPGRSPAQGAASGGGAWVHRGGTSITMSRSRAQHRQSEEGLPMSAQHRMGDLGQGNTVA